MQEATLSDGLLTAAFCLESTWKTPNRLIPAQAWRTVWKSFFRFTIGRASRHGHTSSDRTISRDRPCSDRANSRRANTKGRLKTKFQPSGTGFQTAFLSN